MSAESIISKSVPAFKEAPGEFPGWELNFMAHAMHSKSNHKSLQKPRPKYPSEKALNRTRTVVDGISKDTQETYELIKKTIKKQRMWDRKNEANFANLTLAVAKAPLANQIVKAHSAPIIAKGGTPNTRKLLKLLRETFHKMSIKHIQSEKTSFYGMKMNAREGVTSYLTRILDGAYRLEAMGEHLDYDKDVLPRLLVGLQNSENERYRNLANAFNVAVDLTWTKAVTLAMEEELNKQTSSASAAEPKVDHAHFAGNKKKFKTNKHCVFHPNSKTHNTNECRNSQNKKYTNEKKKNNNTYQPNCLHCGKPGHKMKDCFTRIRQAKELAGNEKEEKHENKKGYSFAATEVRKTYKNENEPEKPTKYDFCMMAKVEVNIKDKQDIDLKIQIPDGSPGDPSPINEEGKSPWARLPISNTGYRFVRCACGLIHNDDFCSQGRRTMAKATPPASLDEIPILYGDKNKKRKRCISEGRELDDKVLGKILDLMETTPEDDQMKVREIRNEMKRLLTWIDNIENKRERVPQGLEYDVLHWSHKLEEAIRIRDKNEEERRYLGIRYEAYYPNGPLDRKRPSSPTGDWAPGTSATDPRLISTPSELKSPPKSSAIDEPFAGCAYMVKETKHQVRNKNRSRRVKKYFLPAIEEEVEETKFEKNNSPKLLAGLDTCASKHMLPTNYINENILIDQSSKHIIQTANAGVNITADGTADYIGKHLKNVLLIPADQLAKTLISVPQFDMLGYRTEFYKGVGRVYDRKNRTVIEAPLVDGIYQFDLSQIVNTEFLENIERSDPSEKYTSAMLGSAQPVLDMTLLHCRCGHRSPAVLNYLLKNSMLPGIHMSSMSEKDLKALPVCEYCVAAKYTRCGLKSSDMPGKKEYTTEPCEFWSTDFKGPFKTEGINGERWYQGFIDFNTRWIEPFCVSSRDKAFENLQKLYSEPDIKDHMKFYRSDNACELLSQQIVKFLRDRNITISPSPPYTHNGNSIIERSNRTVFEPAFAMILESGLPHFLWPYAVMHSCFMHNILPTNTTEWGWIVPFEKRFGKKPDLSKLRKWGCVAYTLIDESQRAKGFDEKSSKGHFVGWFNEGAGAYVYFPHLNKVMPVGHIIFDENAEAPAPKSSQHMPFEIDPTPRKLEDYKYLEYMAYRDNGRLYFTTRVINQRKSGFIVAFRSELTPDNRVHPEEESPIHVQDVERMVREYQATNPITVVNEDGTCTPIVERAAINGRVEAHASSGLLPVEQVPVTSLDVRLGSLIDSADHADSPRDESTSDFNSPEIVDTQNRVTGSESNRNQ